MRPRRGPGRGKRVGEGESMLGCTSGAAPACGITAEIVAVVEALGLATRQGERLVAGGEPADPARARLVVLGLQIGLLADELAELLALYDTAAEDERGLSRFVTLLASYQRFVGWRRAGRASGP